MSRRKEIAVTVSVPLVPNSAQVCWCVQNISHITKDKFTYEEEVKLVEKIWEAIVRYPYRF